jgi:hypothetical protein
MAQVSNRIAYFIAYDGGIVYKIWFRIGDRSNHQDTVPKIRQCRESNPLYSVHKYTVSSYKVSKYWFGKHR